MQLGIIERYLFWEH